MNAGTIETPLAIPEPLYRQLENEAKRLGCSPQELILESLQRLLAGTVSQSGYRVSLPLVPAEGRQMHPVTNEDALFA